MDINLDECMENASPSVHQKCTGESKLIVVDLFTCVTVCFPIPVRYLDGDRETIKRFISSNLYLPILPGSTQPQPSHAIQKMAVYRSSHKLHYQTRAIVRGMSTRVRFQW